MFERQIDRFALPNAEILRPPPISLPIRCLPRQNRIRIDMVKPPRKNPTKAMERRVLLEAAGKCPWCESGKKLLAAEATIHHIDGDRSNTVLENLILTCRNHHGQIEDKLIPLWEVTLKKTCLSNPATMARLGLRVIDPQRGPKRRQRGKQTVVAGDNSGVAAGIIHNSGTIAGTIKVEKLPRGPVRVAGSLLTSADHYGYVEYLVKRLSYYRSWRPGCGGPTDNPGAVRKIFERDFGRLPKDLSLDRFGDAVAYLHGKLAKTFLGKIGKARVSSFEDWKRKGRPIK
jgi:hypothetical protein